MSTRLPDRSERQLMRHAADRLSVRWYVGYDLGESLPDHSSVTRIRERYGVEVFRRFFDAIVEQCQEAGLVWGRELYFDGTKVLANASTDSVKPRFAVEAHLAHLFAPEAQESAEEGERERTQQEPASNGLMQQEATEVPRPLAISLSPEVYEELSQQNEARHDWIEQLGAQDRSVSSKWYQRVADLRVSTTDPDASLMLTKDGAHVGYHTHYVVDGGKSRIILQALVTPSEVMDNQPMLDLLWRVRFRWKLRPRQITGDTKYGTAENIMAIERESIRAYVPLPDFEHRSPYFSQRDFRYDADQDVYVCPNNAVLRLHTSSPAEHARRYQAEAATCNACPLKAQCTPGTSGRYISRNFAEEYFERVRFYQTTEAYKKALRKRSVWVEPLFAEGKEWHGMQRFRLRELWRVNCEGLMRAAGQNLKRLLQKPGWGLRPFPPTPISSSFC